MQVMLQMVVLFMVVVVMAHCRNPFQALPLPLPHGTRTGTPHLLGGHRQLRSLLDVLHCTNETSTTQHRSTTASVDDTYSVATPGPVQPPDFALSLDPSRYDHTPPDSPAIRNHDSFYSHIYAAATGPRT